MQRGDHIYVKRPGYAHHGIYVGNDNVIHFAGPTKRQAAIVRTDLGTFSRGLPVQVAAYNDRLSADVSVARAEARLGDAGYLLLWNNCEHFARWCATGDRRSAQVERGLGGIGVVTTPVAGAKAAVGVAASVGPLSGVSGPSLMSGLAAFGPGGAVGGLFTLTLAPTICGGVAAHALLRDDECLDERARRARRHGRCGAIVGTLLTGAVLLKVLSVLGVPGLSAAGITSALATIGGLVGLGMLAGIALFAIAPLLGMIAGGAGGYAVGRFA